MTRFPTNNSRLIFLLSYCWFFVFGTALVGQSSTADLTDGRKKLRILSYNIHHGAGVDGKLDLERIAKTILSVKPDIVALQEIDVSTTRTEKVDQAQKLAELTKLNYVFGGNIKFGGGDYGNAILSRFPIKNSRNLKLPNHRDGEQRGLLQVEIKPDFVKEPVYFWCTHLDYRKNDSERVASAKVINELLKASKYKYCFLAGDLNDVPGSRTLESLGEDWKASNSSPLPTVPVRKPIRQIDFVLAKKDSKVECVKTLVLPEAVASDHRAVLAVYLFK